MICIVWGPKWEVAKPIHSLMSYELKRMWTWFSAYLSQFSMEFTWLAMAHFGPQIMQIMLNTPFIHERIAFCSLFECRIYIYSFLAKIFEYSNHSLETLLGVFYAPPPVLRPGSTAPDVFSYSLSNIQPKGVLGSVWRTPPWLKCEGASNAHQSTTLILPNLFQSSSIYCMLIGNVN